MELDKGSSHPSRARPPRSRSKARSRSRSTSQPRESDPPSSPPTDPFTTDPAMRTDKLLVRTVPVELFSLASLTSHFSTIPSINVVNVSLRGTAESSRRTAVVTFGSPHEATIAMAKGRHYANGTLVLSYFRGPQHANAAGNHAQQPVPTNELLVSFVPKDLYSRAALQDFFTPISNDGVVSVSIKQRQHRDSVKRTAIITFVSIAHAEMVLRNLPLHNGQQLQVAFRGPQVLSAAASQAANTQGRGTPIERWYPETNAPAPASFPQDPFATQSVDAEGDRQLPPPEPFSAPDPFAQQGSQSDAFNNTGMFSDPFNSQPAPTGDPFQSRETSTLDPFGQNSFASGNQSGQSAAVAQPFNAQADPSFHPFNRQPASFPDPFSAPNPAPADPFGSVPPAHNDPFSSDAKDAGPFEKAQPFGAMQENPSSPWPANNALFAQGRPSSRTTGGSSASLSFMAISNDGMDTREDSRLPGSSPERPVKAEPELQGWQEEDSDEIQPSPIAPKPKAPKRSSSSNQARRKPVDQKAEMERLRASIAEKEAQRDRRIAKARAEAEAKSQKAKKWPVSTQPSQQVASTKPTPSPQPTPAWRQVGKRVQLEDAVQLVGTCMKMCPTEEIELRQKQGDISNFERDARGHSPDPEKMVKKYRRSAAIAEQPKPCDVRPPKMLSETMEYLKAVCDTKDTKFVDIHNFVRDRTRSLRQDFTLQGVRDELSIKVHEESVRFHIMSAFCLDGMDPSVFSAKQNYEQLDKCLVSLREMYGSRHEQKLPMSPNEPEIQAYFLLRNIDDRRGLVELFIRLTAEVRRSLPVQFALQVFHVSSSTFCNAATFFSCARAAPYLMACLMYSKFTEVRCASLAAMNYSNGLSRSKDAIDVSMLTVRLGFDRDEETVDFCNEVGMSILPKDGYGLSPAQLEVRTPSPAFNRRDIKWIPKKPILLIESKARSFTISEIVSGVGKYDFDMLALPGSVSSRLQKCKEKHSFRPTPKRTAVIENPFLPTRQNISGTKDKKKEVRDTSPKVRSEGECFAPAKKPFPDFSEETIAAVPVKDSIAKSVANTAPVFPKPSVFSLPKPAPTPDIPSQPFGPPFPGSMNPVVPPTSEQKDNIEKGITPLSVPNAIPQFPFVFTEQNKPLGASKPAVNPGSSMLFGNSTVTNNVPKEIARPPSQNVPTIPPSQATIGKRKEQNPDKEVVRASTKPKLDQKSLSLKELNDIREEAAQIIWDGHKALEPIEQFTDNFWDDENLVNVQKNCEDAFATIEYFAGKLCAIIARAEAFKATCSETKVSKDELLKQLEDVRDIGNYVWKRVWGIMGRVHMGITDSANPWLPCYEESSPHSELHQRLKPPKTKVKGSFASFPPPTLVPCREKFRVRAVEVLREEMIRHGLPRWQAAICELEIPQYSGRGFALKWVEQELSKDQSVGKRREDKVVNMHLSQAAKFSVHKILPGACLPRSSNLVICGIDIPQAATVDNLLAEALKNMLSNQRALSIDSGLPAPRLIVVLAHSSPSYIGQKGDIRASELVRNLQLDFLSSSSLISHYEIVPTFKSLLEPLDSLNLFNDVVLDTVSGTKYDLERKGLKVYVNSLGDRLIDEANSAWMRYVNSCRTLEMISSYGQIIHSVNQSWACFATMIEREILRCPVEFESEIQYLRCIQSLTQKVRLPRSPDLLALNGKQYIERLSEKLHVCRPVQNLESISPLSYFCQALALLLRPFVSSCLGYGNYSKRFLLPRSPNSAEDSKIFSTLSRDTSDAKSVRLSTPEHVERAWDGTPIRCEGRPNYMSRKRAEYDVAMTRSVPRGKRLRSDGSVGRSIVFERPSRRYSDYSLKRTLEFSPSPAKRRRSLPPGESKVSPSGTKDTMKLMYDAELAQLRMIDNTINRLAALKSGHA